MVWERASTLKSTEPEELEGSTRPHLFVVHAPSAPPGRGSYALDDRVWNIGRSGTAPAIHLRDARVSRLHAELHVSSGGRELWLLDKSANGTFVDGRRVTESQLTDGSVVRLGDTILLVRYVPDTLRNAVIEGLNGSAPCMASLRHDIARVARDDASVLVLGESGTGKELVAQALHRLSQARGAFVAVNCAAITESVAESLLFGHVGGAFTGARQDHDGYFRAAHQGTLFLDEIGDLPASIQPKLLRALESGAILPVGASLAVPCRVRLVAATHKDLAHEVEAGRFRGDLFARISHLTVRTPPLRTRREDILPLFHAAAGELTLPTPIAERLLVHGWPYNVRELLSIAKRVRVLGLQDGTRDLALPRAGDVKASDEPHRPEPEKAREREAPPTRDQVIEAVEAARGNVRRAAEALGRSRKQVYRYLELYQIDCDAVRER